MKTYPADHPFSPLYRGRVAAELSAPRYPNRSQPPTAAARRKLCRGETPAGATLRKETK